MQQEDIRFIVNPFQKIVNIIKPDHDRLYNLLFNDIQEFIGGSGLPTLVSLASLPDKSEVDVSAYSGVGGYVYTLIRLARFFANEKMTNEKTESIIHSSSIADDGVINQLKNPKYYLDLATKQYTLIANHYATNKPSLNTLSFYMSQTCLWLCGMQLGFETTDLHLFRECEQRLLVCYDYYVQNKGKMIFQLLYGVPGFLYVFLELQKEFDNHPLQQFRTNFAPMSRQLTLDIIQSGVHTYEQLNNTKVNIVDLSKELPQNFRLCYLFHKKQYLGGAHGLGGNLNILMLSMSLNSFSQEQMTIWCRLISRSVLFLMRHFINGNFSTSAGSTKIKLVHFCHGAPGIISSLARFMNMFPEEAIKLGVPQAIQKSLHHVWEFGVLRKGFNLCHGISGNAYAFISSQLQVAFPQQVEDLHKKAILFALLKQQKQVMKQIRRYQFPDRMKVGFSDEPYSLMLGLAGDICFQIDVLSGVGRFPGFDF